MIGDGVPQEGFMGDRSGWSSVSETLCRVSLDGLRVSSRGRCGGVCFDNCG